MMVYQVKVKTSVCLSINLSIQLYMHEGKDLALKLCWITVLQSNVLALNTVSAQMTAVPSNGLTHTVGNMTKHLTIIVY